MLKDTFPFKNQVFKASKFPYAGQEGTVKVLLSKSVLKTVEKLGDCFKFKSVSITSHMDLSP